MVVPKHGDLIFLYLSTYEYVHHSEKIQNIVVASCIIFNTRVKRLQNKFIVNGDDHVTTIHVLVMSSKLIKHLSYYVAHLILIFLATYLDPYQ